MKMVYMQSLLTFIISIILYFIYQYDVLLFHIIFDIAILIIGFSVVMSSLVSSKLSVNRFIIIIGPGFAAVSIIFFINIIYLSGFNSNPLNDNNLQRQLLLFSSYIQSSAILIGLLFYNKKYNYLAGFTAFIALGLLLTILTVLGVLPDVYIEGEGLTLFSDIIEIFVIGIYLTSISIIIGKKYYLESKFIKFLIVALIFFTLGEVLFLYNNDLHSIEKFIGLVFRLLGFIEIYWILITWVISGQINLLNENLKLGEAKVKSSVDKVIRTEEMMRLILDTTEEGVYGVDNDDICTFINKSFIQMLNFTETDAIGKKMHSLIHHSYPDGSVYPTEDCKMLKSFKKGEKLTIRNETLWTKDGLKIPVEYSSNPQYKDGEIIGSVVSFKDISERIKYEKSLISMSYTDSLTGIYNRRYFEKKILELDNPKYYPLTLISSDINGLKFVNDSFGHDVGDELLITVSKILSSNIAINGFVSRTGGDEFISVIPNSETEKIDEYIETLKKSISKEKIHSIKISVAFGYETKKDTNELLSNIYKEAENRMYQAKLLKGSSMRSNATETIMKTLNEKDYYSEVHSRSVSQLSERIAIELKMNVTKVNQIRTAGLLHDIGKIIVSSEILNKVGKLTIEEFAQIKNHSQIGFRILNTSRDMKEISNIILFHHERWDGEGYPNKISKEKIPLESRIIAVADSFDAMTSDRSYRIKISKEEALEEIIRCSGTQFDPLVVEAFKNGFKRIVI